MKWFVTGHDGEPERPADECDRRVVSEIARSLRRSGQDGVMAESSRQCPRSRRPEMHRPDVLSGSMSYAVRARRDVSVHIGASFGASWQRGGSGEPLLTRSGCARPTLQVANARRGTAWGGAIPGQAQPRRLLATLFVAAAASCRVRRRRCSGAIAPPTAGAARRSQVTRRTRCPSPLRAPSPRDEGGQPDRQLGGGAPAIVREGTHVCKQRRERRGQTRGDAELAILERYEHGALDRGAPGWLGPERLR